MVRNWQSRVELNETRRHDAKQRKQRSEDKRLYKNMGIKLMGLLDRHRDSLRKVKIKGRDGSHRRILHIWTDTLAADSSLPDSLLSDEGPATGNKQRKPRSGSIESDEGNGKKGKGSKKKVHPRSHEAAAIDTPENVSKCDDLVLCKPHFFTGKCRQHHGPGWRVSSHALHDTPVQDIECHLL
jgi:hypothetical protein